MSRIGVFICHCGHNISGAVDIDALKKKVAQIPDVIFVIDNPYLCSTPGQELVGDMIKEHQLDGVVTSHCSPLLHERTFRNVAEKSGLNPYKLEVANIREQASWPHWHQPDLATKKAFTIICETVAKVKRNMALEETSVPITNRAMVIGGGVAGIQTALDIADGGYKVYLIEQDSTIGGKMIQLSETFPTLDCPQCIMTPKMTDVANHPNIELLSYSELDELDGYIGNFKAKVRRKARYINEEKCTGCGDCTQACPIYNQPVIRQAPEYSEFMDKEFIEKIEPCVTPYVGQSSALVQVLLDVNTKFKYLPQDALKYVSEKLRVPLSKVYEVATFYNAFSLKPRGEHIIRVCMGTACHARGSPRVLEEIERRLGIGPNETTQDNKYCLETVNCLGCCALGPVVTIDDNYFHADPSDVNPLFDRFERGVLGND